MGCSLNAIASEYGFYVTRVIVLVIKHVDAVVYGCSVKDARSVW